jgi:hypothetical protein
MREIIVDKGQKREISIVEKTKYYTFKNISGNKFVIPGTIFDVDEVKDDIDESQYRYIMKHKYIDNWKLVELDDDGNPMTSIDGAIKQDPLDEDSLISIIKSEKKLKDFLKDLTADRKHVLTKMKQLCIDHGLSTKSFLKIKEKDNEFNDMPIGV